MRRWLIKKKKKRRKRKIHPYDPKRSEKLDKQLEKGLCLSIWIIIIAICLI